MRFVWCPLAFGICFIDKSIRYLTKLCDQVTAFISPAHASSIVWREQDDEGTLTAMEEDEDESDRMFTFEVTKTNEQEESVTPLPGFKVSIIHHY